MNIIPVDLPDVVLIEPKIFADQRGYFCETYQTQRSSDRGIEVKFVQDNLSFSRRGVVRGLHLDQLQEDSQGKWSVDLQGEVVDPGGRYSFGLPHFRQVDPKYPGRGESPARFMFHQVLPMAPRLPAKQQSALK